MTDPVVAWLPRCLVACSARRTTPGLPPTSLGLRAKPAPSIGHRVSDPVQLQLYSDITQCCDSWVQEVELNTPTGPADRVHQRASGRHDPLLLRWGQRSRRVRRIGQSQPVLRARHQLHRRTVDDVLRHCRGRLLLRDRPECITSGTWSTAPGAIVERYCYDSYGKPLIREAVGRGDFDTDADMDSTDRAYLENVIAGWRLGSALRYERLWWRRRQRSERVRQQGPELAAATDVPLSDRGSGLQRRRQPPTCGRACPTSPWTARRTPPRPRCR